MQSVRIFNIMRIHAAPRRRGRGAPRERRPAGEAPWERRSAGEAPRGRGAPRERRPRRGAPRERRPRRVGTIGTKTGPKLSKVCTIRGGLGPKLSKVATIGAQIGPSGHDRCLDTLSYDQSRRVLDTIDKFEGSSGPRAKWRREAP